MDAERADLERRFRMFADVCEDETRLYALLSRGVLNNKHLCTLAGRAQPKQPTPNLLFGAVHALLLDGTDHPLQRYYPSVGGTAAVDDEACGLFAEFCERFEGPIGEMIATRRVQTNEVGRCGLLMPAFAYVQQCAGGRPLHLIDVGTSAGLNLCFDQYQYEYRQGQTVVHTCGPASPACVRTLLEGDEPCPLPEHLPVVAGRVGVDIAPVDVTDASAMRWVEALIWPDQLERLELFRAAVQVARRSPPRVVGGDGLELVPNLVREVEQDALPCVFHSYATCQMDTPWQTAFQACLEQLGKERDVAHIALEWAKGDTCPRLQYTSYEFGKTKSVRLADGHHHGRWLRWRAA